jgi:hypothetical protein
MNESAELFFRLLNGSFTVLIALLLYRIYQRRRRNRFYLSWGIGFLGYGLSIFVRIFSPQIIVVTPLGILAFMFLFSGWISMLIGIGELVQETRRVSLAMTLFPLLLGALYLNGAKFVYVVYALTLFPYLLTGVILTIIQIKYHLDLKLLISGWFFILLINIGYVSNQLDPGYVDLLSTFGKGVVFWGMASTRFSFIDEELKEFLLRGIPTEYMNAFTGKLLLINMENSDRRAEISWIEKRVLENSRKAVRTILLTYYDVISPRDVIKNEIKNDLYMVRVIPGGRSFTEPFSQHIISIKDDINELEMLFSDIINFSNENKVPCEIIIHSLSHMVHTHGWKRVYSFLISKNSALKTSMVQLLAFYYPNTHEAKAEIIIFERLADNVIKT